MPFRRVLLALLTLLAAYVPARSAAANPTCITIQRGGGGVVADALIGSHNLAKNFGKSGALSVGSAEVGLRQSLLRFDLAAVPAGATITSAAVTLDVLRYGGGAVRAHRITAPWSEASVTWTSFGGAFLPQVDATFPIGSPTSADLQALVQAWVSGSLPNHGILIERDLDGTTVFASSEESPAKRPRLDVCYTPAVVSVCGDGAATGTEACDDSNTLAGDGCSAACSVESGFTCSGSPSACATICGDAAVAGAETCDDGNAMAGDGCNAACSVEGGFTCDGSPSICAPTCGDGITVSSEPCDDSNTASGDGCSAACSVEGGFTCDGSPSACATICGDAAVVGAETCDDGNAMTGDGCNAACSVEGGFTCDGSPSICAPTCGDGIMVSSEPCDDSNTASGDGCSAACSVEGGFTCDGSPSACATICGDGIRVGAEGCDDGNAASSDGCSAACSVEGGFACGGSPSVCTCANGTPCTDGSACTQGDVCNAGACAGTPVVCAPAECQSVGACDPSNGCVLVQAADGAGCTGGACQGGQCVPTQLLVSVYDRNGYPILNTRIKVGSAQKFTNAQGQVTFSAIPAGNTVVKVTKTGYVPASPSSDVQAGASNSIVAHLLEEGESVPFEVASGIDTIVDNKVRVMIPGNAVVDSGGNPVTGVVEMTVAPLDPSTDIDMMPGALVGVATGDVMPVGLVSVFMADISLRKGTTAVQLAPGAQATVEFTLPDELQSVYMVGDSIDAWYFDLAQGIWIQDGTGIVTDSLAEPGKLVWTVQVSHFTWWNADFVKPQRDCVVVTVQQSDTPQFIGGATVTVASLSNNYYRYSGTTNGTTGQTCIDMPINDVVRVTASHTTFPNIAGGAPQILTGTNLNGPTCAGGGVGTCQSLTILLGGTTCISGVVEDGVGGVIDGARVIARYDTGRGPESTTTFADVDGEYCVSAPVGAQVIVQASSLGDVMTAQRTVPTANTEGACGAISCTNAGTITPACNATCATSASGFGDAALQTARDVAVDASGNVFITGYFAGTMTGLGLTSNGLDDIYVAKLDQDGTLLWAKRFGDVAGTGIQQAYSIAVDSVGNPVIVGSFTNTITFPRPSPLADLTLTAVQGFDGFITKISGLDGTAIEARRIGGTGNQRLVDVMMDNSNPAHPDSLVILGHFNDQIDCSGGVGGVVCPANGSGDDMLIMKIFSNSFWVWSQTYGGPGDEHPLHGGLNTIGDLIVTGDFNSAFSFGSPTSTLTPSSSGTDAFVARIKLPTSPFGTDGPVWSRGFGAGTCALPGNRSGRGAAFDGLGNVWLTGDFNGCIAMPTLETAAGAPATDAFVARLNGGTGATLSYDIIRNASQQHGSDITVDTDGGLLLTGTVRGTITFGSLPPKPRVGLEDVFIAKLNTAGNYVWATRFGGNPTSVVANPAIAVRPFASGAVAGNIALTGTFTGSLVFDATNGVGVVSSGSADVFVSKMLSVQ